MKLYLTDNENMMTGSTSRMDITKTCDVK